MNFLETLVSCIWEESRRLLEFAGKTVTRSYLGVLFGSVSQFQPNGLLIYAGQSDIVEYVGLYVDYSKS